MIYPKFTVTESTMKKLFEPGGFFHTCRQEDILSEGSTWYICKSSDGKLLLLVQVVDTISTTLASLRWEGKPYTKTTNPWLLKKETESRDIQSSITDIVDTLFQPHHKRIRFGMMQWNN